MVSIIDNTLENTILIIADARELYPSIPQDNGVKSCKNVLIRRMK